MFSQHVHYATLDEARDLRSNTVAASRPMFLASDVVADIARTIGRRKAESGGPLFGGKDGDGVDQFELDERGSAAAGPGIYRPDSIWCRERQEHWLAVEDKNVKIIDGFVHSHPAGHPFPSPKAGEAEGDLGYAEALLDANHYLDRVLLPIVQGVRSSTLVLWPWVVERSDLRAPKLAELICCESTDFPPRVLNPVWLAENLPLPPIRTPIMVSLDLDRIAGCLPTGAALASTDRELLVAYDDCRLRVALPTSFPAAAPTLFYGDIEVPVRWASQSDTAVEVRLAALISRYLVCFTNNY